MLLVIFIDGPAYLDIISPLSSERLLAYLGKPLIKSDNEVRN